MIGKPVDPPSGPGPLIPWTVSDFLSYLQKIENELESWPRAADVQRVLSDLERAGFLQNSGLDLSRSAMFNTTYWWRGGITTAQQGGLLGFSEVVGHGLIIESYKAVTAPIARPGVAGIGSGLVIGPWHILTIFLSSP